MKPKETTSITLLDRAFKSFVMDFYEATGKLRNYKRNNEYYKLYKNKMFRDSENTEIRPFIEEMIDNEYVKLSDKLLR
jgi:hypothetical protein